MAMESNPSPFTILITVTGDNTDQVNYDMILKVLRQHANIYSDHILSLSSSGKPDVWYLKLTDHANSRLYDEFHGTRYVHHRNIVFTFKHLDKKYIWASLQWVPLLFFKADVQEIVEKISKPFTEVFVKNELNGRWTICFVPGNVNIPHYINVKYGANNCNTILLVLSGRKQVCYICGEADHNISICPYETLPKAKLEELKSQLFTAEVQLNDEYSQNSNPSQKQCMGGNSASIMWTDDDTDSILSMAPSWSSNPDDTDSVLAMAPSWSSNPEETWYVDKFETLPNLKNPQSPPESGSMLETKTVSQAEKAPDDFTSQCMEMPEIRKNYLAGLETALHLVAAVPLLQDLDTDLDMAMLLGQENEETLPHEMVEEIKNLGISQPSSSTEQQSPHSPLLFCDETMFDSDESDDFKFNIIETVADIEQQPPFDDSIPESCEDLVVKPPEPLNRGCATAITYSEEAKMAAYKRLLPFTLSDEEVSRIQLLETTYEPEPDSARPKMEEKTMNKEDKGSKDKNRVFSALRQDELMATELIEKTFTFRPWETKESTKSNKKGKM